MNVGPSPRRYTPRTRIDPAAVAVLNAVARPRDGLSAIIEGLALRLAPAGVADEAAPSPEDTEITLAVAEADTLALCLPGAILDRLARAVQADLPALPPGPAGLFLLELALAPLLDVAEGIAGRTLRIEAVAPAARWPGAVVLRLDGALDGAVFTAFLALPPSGAATDAALALLRGLPKRDVPVPEIALPLAWEAGITRLSAGQIAGLSPGDVVLPDLWHPKRRAIRLVLGTTHAAMAVADARRAKLRTTFRPIPAGPTARGTDGMTEATGQATANEAETAGSGLDAVGLTLSFELGRQVMTLAELKDVGPGHILDLGVATDEAVDLVVNGSRIGRGEIVTIGERLGVRVVRLFGQGRDA